MSLLDESKISIALKSSVGVAQTDNSKEPSNELYKSFPTVSSTTVFGETIPSTPSSASLFDITSGTVEFVRLELIPDPSANGHAFLAKLPSNYSASSTSSRVGVGDFVSSKLLAETKGLVQIVPSTFGVDYEAKPYRGGTSAKGSGELVAPGDLIDWNLNYANGILFQENDPNTAPNDITYLECYIWVGKMVTEAISSATDPLSDLISESSTTINIGETNIDSFETDGFSGTKWIITAKEGTKMFCSEVFAGFINANLDYTEYAKLSLGNPGGNFYDVDVRLTNPGLSNETINLFITTDTNNVDISIVKIKVK